MEFSLFNLMTKPRNGPSHAEVFEQMRAMTRMADQGGFDIAWFAEHHLSNYSVSPSPLLPAVHMAAETKNLRVGPAVIVMPFYEPLRLVEEICVADQLTNGRLVLGLGTGYQPREFKKFGFEINNRLQRGLEVWDVIYQGLYEGRIDFHGEHVQIEDAALSIAPVQKEIVTFAVGNAPEMRQRMVERGAVPMTTPAVAPSTMTETARRLFMETRAENGIEGEDFPFAVQRYVFVTDDASEARAVAEQILIHARMANNMRQPEPDIEGSDLNIVPFEGEPTVEEILERSIIGSAAQVSERILQEGAELGMTHISVFMQIAGIPYDSALRSLERLCDKVIPAVRAGESREALAS